MKGESTTHFRKEIRLFDAIMLVAGTMIGSGIFLVSPEIVREVGSSGWMMVVWILAGVMTIMGALCYGELSAMFPQAGGQYVYIREAWGKMPAFLYGWTLFLVIQTGTIAAVGMAFANYAASLFPEMEAQRAYITWNLFGTNYGIGNLHLIGIGVTLLITYLNSRGVRHGKWLQNIFGVAKIGAIILLILAGLSIGFQKDIWAANWENLWNARHYVWNDGKLLEINSLEGATLFTAIFTAMTGSLFSSDAWNNVTFAGGEVVNPKKTIGRALLIGTSLVTILYISMNLVYMATLPVIGNPEASGSLERGIAFALNDRVGAASAEVIGGAGLLTFMSILIMVSTFGCQNGCILSGARVYYTMSVDKLFFRRLGKLNAQGVPGKALWIQGVWASFLCLSGTYNELLIYVMFAVILFYMITIGGIFQLRLKKPELERPFKVPLYPWLPSLYLLMSGIFVINLIQSSPDYALRGMYIIMAGIPIYFIFKRKKEQTNQL